MKNKWHLDVLSTHSSNMFNKLLHEHQLSSDVLKEIEFEDDQGIPIDPIRGYFAKKDKLKYWIDEALVKKMPIRLGTVFEELKYNEDMVFRPLNPAPFKIRPEQKLTVRQLVDDFVPFKHTHPDQWLLMKFISLMGYIGRTYTCQSTIPAFGKSSCYNALHYITDKSPVFQPRSVPGVLNHINGTGNMIFDEVQQCKKDVKDIMENIALQIGGGTPEYINGALKSRNTKSKYNCQIQSITFLYNTVECYNSYDHFFESKKLWSDKKALDNRFLKFKLYGVLEENFDRNFDIPGTAAKYKMYYLDFAKTLLYLQGLKQQNGYVRRYINNSTLKLQVRHKLTYDEITWLIDQYAQTQEEYDKIIKVMDDAILAYQEMCMLYDDTYEKIKEEMVTEDGI